MRRIRRRADCSQRELATGVGTSKSAIAAAETGAAGVDARLLASAAHLAGLRLALLDAAGEEVCGTHPDAAACDELDDWSGRPVHAQACPCSCDVG